MIETPLAASDLAVDYQLSQLGAGFRFILDVTPVDADDVKRDFLDGRCDDPTFTYRDLEIDPEVLQTVLATIDVGRVQDATLASLLRSKHRELDLQLAMLRARDSADFLPLSIEAYGAISPSLLSAAESILERVPKRPASGGRLTAEQFLEVADHEIRYYRELAPQIDIHAEIRHDSTGVMVSGNALLIGPEAGVSRDRANGLVHHEVGTHLVTQVNGTNQPIQTLGSGLAGYDETQEGLAVLAEIACGELTPSRLRQLGARVVTVHRMIGGASFRECWQGLVDAGLGPGGAFTTTMRVFRAGGLTKDVVYLRGLLDLIEHLRRGGSLEPLFVGKFGLVDLPLIEELRARGVLEAPILIPRWFDDPAHQDRLAALAELTDPTHLVQGVAA